MPAVKSVEPVVRRKETNPFRMPDDSSIFVFRNEERERKKKASIFKNLHSSIHMVGPFLTRIKSHNLKTPGFGVHEMVCVCFPLIYTYTNVTTLLVAHLLFLFCFKKR